MAATFIDVESWETTDQSSSRAEVNKSLKTKFMILWMTIRRTVRRVLLRGVNGMAIAFSKLPVFLQRGLVLTAMVVGWTIAWCIVYFSIILAFMYGLGWGLACLFIWCTVLAWYLEG